MIIFYLSIHSNVTNYSQMTDGSGGLKLVGSSDDPNAGLLDDKVGNFFKQISNYNSKHFYVFSSVLHSLGGISILKKDCTSTSPPSSFCLWYQC